MQTGRQADRQTGRQADRQTGRQADRQTGRQADRPRLVEQLGKDGQVEELAAAVQLDAVEPKVDGGLDLALVVVEPVRQRALAELELAGRLRRAPARDVLVLVAPAVVGV
eukprot:SAG22_NODE_94_length_20824_cov_230.693718_16_plen_110_part_00